MRPVSTRCRRLGPGQSRLGFGLGLSPLQAMAPVALHSPGQAPGVRVRSAGVGGTPQRKAGLRPNRGGGVLEAQSAWQRGLLPQWLGRLPTPSACRCCPP